MRSSGSRCHFIAPCQGHTWGRFVGSVASVLGSGGGKQVQPVTGCTCKGQHTTGRGTSEHETATVPFWQSTQSNAQHECCTHCVWYYGACNTWRGARQPFLMVHAQPNTLTHLFPKMWHVQSTVPSPPSTTTRSNC